MMGEISIFSFRGWGGWGCIGMRYVCVCVCVGGGGGGGGGRVLENIGLGNIGPGGFWGGGKQN